MWMCCGIAAVVYILHMANPTITYQLHIEFQQDDVVVSKWVDVDIVLDQKSKSKAKNRSRAAAKVRELYPKCTVHQILYV